MIRLGKIYGILMVATAVATAGCSNTRFLADDQLLYTGSRQVIVSDTSFSDKRTVLRLAEGVTAYKPNNSIGGKRLLPPLGLWIYNYRKPEEGKKPGWFYRTLSDEPVMVSTVDPPVRSRKLESELFSNGYFRAIVWSVTDTSTRNPKKAGVTYYIKPGQPYKYREIIFEPPVDAIDTIIGGFSDDIAMRTNETFRLETVRSEARRISEDVVENGYFYFNQNHVNYTADTLRFPGMIDFKIGKNTDQQPLALRKYVMDDIRVVVSSGDDSIAAAGRPDTIRYSGIDVVLRGVRFKPDVFSRSIYLKPGDYYSLTAHRRTMTHLNSYNIFKFINVSYVPDNDTVANKLDMIVELTPMKDIGLDLEANVVTKSTGFSGPGFSATVSHGNLGMGANRLQIKLNGGFEWQWGTTSPGTLGSLQYNIGVSSSITFPRLLIPRNWIRPGRYNLPQSTVTLGFEFMNKVQYYRMSSVNLGLGYQWKKPDRITHIFYPAFINSIDLLETTTEFDSLLAANPYIKKSFEEQFIVGMKYDFIYDKSLTKDRHGVYFQSGVSTSGNLIDLLVRASSPEEERPYNIRNNTYSQFLKLTVDARYYLNFHDVSFAFRYYTGLGMPYSNSVVMPYVEQFYSGGSNSIRAFIARSLGPGGTPSDPEADIIDQTGDIRLEGNLELRFGLSKTLRGALFLETGNVWLVNTDDTRPEAKFRFDTFVSQLAVGTGFGLRLDFDFFILRLDLGLPLRSPFSFYGDSNWVRNTGDMFRYKVLNFAIGYPF